MGKAAPKSNQPTEAEDRAAILEIIHRNRIAVWMHDFEAYQSCFAREPYLIRWNASNADGIFVREGWDSIAGRVKQLFTKTDWVSRANAYDTRVEKLNLRILGDTAWATFEQHYPGQPDGNPRLYANVTREVRFFERQDGDWRIVFFGIMDLEGGVTNRDALIVLAPDGTVTWQSETATDLLAEDDDLVIRNGRVRIRDSRTNQALQAAIRWAILRDDELLPRRGAVPVLLDAGEGLPIKIYWVIAEGGRVVLSMGGSGVGADRLEVAAKVFGLSPAQTRIAGLVTEGLSLPEIADRMEITANTARTHLNRIYEKTGVRTQPALVRVLLTAVSPV